MIIPAGTDLRRRTIIPTGVREAVSRALRGGAEENAGVSGDILRCSADCLPSPCFLNASLCLAAVIHARCLEKFSPEGKVPPPAYRRCSDILRRFDMRALPVVAAGLFLLAGCIPLDPGPTYADYRPVPVRHEVRPAPRPAPRPAVHKPAPAPRPAMHKPAPRPEMHKAVPAPRPDRQVAPSRPGGKPGPSMQRPAPPQKSRSDGRPVPGRNEPGGRGPGR